MTLVLAETDGITLLVSCLLSVLCQNPPLASSRLLSRSPVLLSCLSWLTWKEAIIKLSCWHQGCRTITESRALSSQSQQQLLHSTSLLIPMTSDWTENIRGRNFNVATCDCGDEFATESVFCEAASELKQVSVLSASSFPPPLPPRFPAREPSVFIGQSQVRRGDSPLDRICFQLFITTGAKVSGERPEELCVVNGADRVLSDRGGEEGEDHSLLWSLVIAEPVHQQRCRSPQYKETFIQEEREGQHDFSGKRHQETLWCWKV